MNTPVNPLNKNPIIAQKKDIEETFKKMEGQFVQALPKHINFNRFMRVALNAVTNTPKLLECDRKSFFLAVMRSAQLGLEPDGLLGQAYLIPYGKTVQLIIGYKGYITLARQSGEISFITAEAVHENDDLDLNYFAIPRFVPRLRGNRGELIGFIAIARFKDESFQFVFMTKDEVDAIRDKTQAWKQALNDAKYDDQGNIIKFVNKWGKEIDSIPWFHHYVEMGKKTAARRLTKYLPLSVQKAEKMESLQEAGVSFEMKDGDIILDDIQDVTPVEDVVEVNKSPESTSSGLIETTQKTTLQKPIQQESLYSDILDDGIPV